MCVDYYSRFPEVEIVHKITTDVDTDKLRKLFCHYDAPVEIVNDNGPQFISSEFTKLINEFGVKHRRITPYHPQSNGEVEQSNRTLKKAIQTALAEGSDWWITQQNFLLHYRNTPHAATGIAPSSLMFSQPIKDKIPVRIQQVVRTPNNLENVDKNYKAKAKARADRRNNARQHPIEPVQLVLVANQKRHRNKC